MNEIKIIQFLLEEVEQEKNKFERWKIEEKRARKEADQNNKHPWQCVKWNEPYPNKTRIADNCRIARRLLMDIAREKTDE